MDMDNKFKMANHGASLDDDAQELLRDLEDDDDEGFEPEDQAQPTQSLVSMLTSSANLESVASGQLQPANSGDAPKYDHELDRYSMKTMNGAPSEETEDRREEQKADPESLQMPAENETNGEDAEAGEETVVINPEEREGREEKNPVADLPRISLTPGDTGRPEASNSIKPFKTVSAEALEPARATLGIAGSKDGAKEAPKDAPKNDEEKHDEPPQEPAKHDETAADSETADARASKKPPIPPKMPAAMPNARILRDGEVAYTQEALNDILPGGKNDDARDLNYKFDDNNWYAQVFNDDYLRTVPRSSPRQSKREAAFIIDRLGIQTGARVLDLCCGFGRHIIELASHGFNMVGLDLSMTMLKKALADAQAQNLVIKFVHGDMRKLSFTGIFDAIYNVQTSFGYFDDLTNFKVLQGMFRALKPGGVVLLETVNRDFIINDLPLRLWWKAKECTILEEIDMDPLSGLLNVQRSFVYDDGRAPWEQKMHIRLYSTTEMRILLMRAGFNIVELSGDYTIPGAYFGHASQKMIYVAEKPRR